jgi:hypothetical protein
MGNPRIRDTKIDEVALTAGGYRVVVNEIAF